MTQQANYRDEWLQKAFKLAHFIHRERRTAIAVALNALSKLEIASNAQFKRFYYTPTGRAEALRATRRRVSLNDLQLLQRLVLIESESYERERETSAQTSEIELLVHFIKHLVRITFKRNSFYVALGTTRILHNYGTSEAMDIYNVIVQDPERVHDDYYFRSRKGVLMKELKTRFEGLLETVKVNRGEERFETKKSAENLTETVNLCLKNFTPWSSFCAVPEKFDPFSDIIESFHFDKKDPDEEHRIEVNRIHAALHPDCFGRLTASLKLPSSEEKLEIPKFMLKNQYADFDDRNWSDPLEIEQAELEQLKKALNAQAERRKALSANLLRVVADGAETACIDLDETDAVNFELDGGAELIEVRVVEKDGDMILATHLLSFDELEKGRRTYSVRLEGGQKVSFDLDPQIDEDGEIVGVKCGIDYAETDWLKRFVLIGRRARKVLAGVSWILKWALTFSALVLVLTLGWIVLQKSGADDLQQSGIPTPETNQSPDIAGIAENRDVPPSVDKQAVKPDLREVPDENRKPSAAQDLQDKPQIVAKVSPKQKPRNDQSNRQPAADQNGIVRVPIRENRPTADCEDCRSDETRSIKGRGKTFAEVKNLYLEMTGSETLQNDFREALISEIQTRTSFSIVNDREQADAVLKVSITAADAKNADQTVTLDVRMVNEKGFVIFPNLKRISGWKYVGPLSKLPARIAVDLQNEQK